MTTKQMQLWQGEPDADDGSEFVHADAKLLLALEENETLQKQLAKERALVSQTQQTVVLLTEQVNTTEAELVHARVKSGSKTSHRS